MNAFCIILLIISNVYGRPSKIPIGSLFAEDEMTQRAFKSSIRAVNKKIMTHEDLNDIYLTTRSLVIDENAFHTAQEACKLINTGIAGIFGVHDKAGASYIASMCDFMDVPYVTAKWDLETIRGNTINLYPHASTLSMVYRHLVEELKWTSFAILYDNVDSLSRMTGLLQLENIKQSTINLYHLGSGPNFRKVLQEIKQSGFLNIIIDCSYDVLETVLIQAQQVGIMSGRHSVIVASLDLQTIDLEPYQYSGVNLTGIRLIDLTNPFVQEILASRHLNWNLTDPSRLRVQPALIYDSVQLFALGCRRLQDSTGANIKRLSCNETETWEHGHSLSNFIRAEEMQGLTGVVKLDPTGFRTNFQLDIISLGKNGLNKIGVWDSSSGIEWLPKIVPPGLEEEKPLRHKHFLVLISLTDPYGMFKESPITLVGNERYEGFAIDIIHEMSKLLGFNYTFEVENVYGSPQNNTANCGDCPGWNGMIGRLMKGEADLAITDLTITADRETAVDFTSPFMNLGISVVFRKPTKAPPGLLSFLLPFSQDIWVHLIGAYILVTLLLFLIGRMCPVEWTNPYPCIKEPEVVETPFTVKDTPFFIIGSLLKSPTGFAPAGVSTRAMATAWWFFCLIMTSTYIANLAAALSTKAVVWSFKTAEELAFQDKIKYGAKDGGSTLAFFEHSEYPPYQKMYKVMHENAKDVLPSSNEAGLTKVQQENYAFFMESTSIAYFQQRICNITQIGGLLDAKGYGVAMRKNAPYRNELSGAILRLKENGMINELRDKWWKQKRGGDKCEEQESVKVEPLNFEDVGGVFLILVCGVMLSWIYTIASLLWHVWNVSRKRKVSFKEEILKELQFLVKCSGRKTIKTR